MANNGKLPYSRTVPLQYSMNAEVRSVGMGTTWHGMVDLPALIHVHQGWAVDQSPGSSSKRVNAAGYRTKGPLSNFSLILQPYKPTPIHHTYNTMLSRFFPAEPSGVEHFFWAVSCIYIYQFFLPRPSNLRSLGDTQLCRKIGVAVVCNHFLLTTLT